VPGNGCVIESCHQCSPQIFIVLSEQEVFVCTLIIIFKISMSELCYSLSFIFSSCTSQYFISIWKKRICKYMGAFICIVTFHM